MNSVFNTSAEAALRILLLLSYGTVPIDLDRIVAIDTIIIYGHSLGYADYDLHANSIRRLNEYAARRYNDKNALKRLAFTGYVSIDMGQDMISYFITEKGMHAVKLMNSEYANKYLDNAQRVINALQDFSSRDIIHIAQETKAVIE